MLVCGLSYFKSCTSVADNTMHRVCYLALQIHGGVGYMREFNVERHCRDVRVTNIYEGTSQLQIVAAIGKLMSRTLDPLLDEWAALDYGAELTPLKEQLVEATELFRQSIDHLKGQDPDIIDYHASDLADMAVYIVNGWLMLQDATRLERKRDIAKLYLTEHLPQVHSAHAIILAADGAALEAQEAILSV